jgi:hypothetical protein
VSPKEKLSEDVAVPCARCGNEAKVVWRHGLLRVACLSFSSHRSRFYQDQRSAIMAWNLHQSKLFMATRPDYFKKKG